MPPRAPASPEYSTFLDVVLDHVCCTAEDDNNPSAHKDFVMPSMTGAHQDEHQQQRQPQAQPQHALSSQRGRPQSRSTGNLSQLQFEDRGRDQQQHKQYESIIQRPELTILPHLRFQPLPEPATYGSSLQDFFALFLADRAPHSFKQFHKSNGDENVKVTLWKKVNSNKTSRCREECKLERTITFQTNITPGSSSNPLSQQEKSNSNSATVIPLEVTIQQSLIQCSKTWVLECKFSFDFQSAPTSSVISTGSGVGKKLGTGLGQYLMSNVVKSTTVNVVVTLNECDVNDGNPTFRGVGPMSGNASVASVPTPGCHDGLLSCFSHPLLLPPDGLCSASLGGKGRRGLKTFNKSKSDSCRYAMNAKEPSEVGASLLSAIKAKNIVNDEEFGTPERGPRAPADIPFAASACGVMPSLPKLKQSKKSSGQQGGDSHEDVLNCTSRGSLKLKHIPSFGISRAPSTVSMRRMILEKDRSMGLNLNTSASSDPYLPAAGTPCDAVPTPVARTTPKGLSMRIEMAIGSINNSSQSTPSTASTSLSSSFPRSASISTIDDKVRRGLKKRVARSWISWAESWCMRLWEEEAVDEQRRKEKLGNQNKRPTKNVRPSVRKIGDTATRDKKERKISPVPSSSKSGKTKALAPKNVWEPLQTSGKRSGSRMNASWMSSEQEGEFGVEVTCTMPATPGRRSPATIVKNRLSKSLEDSGNRSSKGRRLLKSLSGTVST